MSDNNFAKVSSAPGVISTTGVSEFHDTMIQCIDCTEAFVWTAGEQSFFAEKQLVNPPKRCKECKRAKNRRLAAIELAQATGRPHKIEVAAQCAECGEKTTVPFYPSQGRPVYCRACFERSKAEATSA